MLIILEQVAFEWAPQLSSTLKIEKNSFFFSLFGWLKTSNMYIGKVRQLNIIRHTPNNFSIVYPLNEIRETSGVFHVYF